MIKIIEAIVVLALLLFSFFIGVKYSDQVRERAGWLFETKEEEIELPNINSEGGVEIEIPAEENNQYNQEVIIDDENSANNPANNHNGGNANPPMDNVPAPAMEGPKPTKK